MKEEMIVEEIQNEEVTPLATYKRPIYLKSPQMYGEDVKDVQRRLNALKYNAGTVDGYFGPSGDKAVRAFQGKNKLSVDGSVGPATHKKLFSSSAIPNTGGGSGSGYTRPIYLKSPQMYGEDVKKVQRRLNELKYNAGTVDGYFGPSGDKAVRAFQGKNGLSVDGSVGPATWNKLFSTSAKPNTGGGSGVGTNVIEPLYTLTPDLFTLSVKEGGDYNRRYRMYSHGCYESSGSKVWYKDVWDTNSTLEIYHRIKGVNNAYKNLESFLFSEGAKETAEYIANLLVGWAVASSTPIPLDDLYLMLKGISAAAEFVNKTAFMTYCYDLASNMTHLNYHWKKI